MGIYLWGLSQNALTTALTQTAHFILSVEDIAQEKLEEIRPQDLTEDEAEEFDDEHYHQVEKTARIEVYEEIEKVLSTVKEFMQISRLTNEEPGEYLTYFVMKVFRMNLKHLFVHLIQITLKQ